jgi:hypothetical protein
MEAFKNLRKAPLLVFLKLIALFWKNNWFNPVNWQQIKLSTATNDQGHPKVVHEHHVPYEPGQEKEVFREHKRSKARQQPWPHPIHLHAPSCFNNTGQEMGF